MASIGRSLLERKCPLGMWQDVWSRAPCFSDIQEIHVNTCQCSSVWNLVAVMPIKLFLECMGVQIIRETARQCMCDWEVVWGPERDLQEREALARSSHAGNGGCFWGSRCWGWPASVQSEQRTAQGKQDKNAWAGAARTLGRQLLWPHFGTGHYVLLVAFWAAYVMGYTQHQIWYCYSQSYTQTLDLDGVTVLWCLPIVPTLRTHSL